MGNKLAQGVEHRTQFLSALIWACGEFHTQLSDFRCELQKSY